MQRQSSNAGDRDSSLITAPPVCVLVFGGARGVLINGGGVREAKALGFRGLGINRLKVNMDAAGAASCRGARLTDC